MSESNRYGNNPFWCLRISLPLRISLKKFVFQRNIYEAHATDSGDLLEAKVEGLAMASRYRGKIKALFRSLRFC